MSSKSIAYIDSYTWLGSRLGLERMRELMDRMGNPQEEIKFVHLAGTNGKGSTACFLASILQSAGYKTGLYTSPFIHTFHERMQIDGVPISDAALDEVVDQMRRHADMMPDHPTTFELTTAAAFTWFAQEKCDIVVLETGMGGSLDATNVIFSPEVAVITPIDLDHMEHLGPTVGEIAKSKAGIIKPGRPVVTARQRQEAMAVLTETAARQGCDLTEVNLAALIPGPFSFNGQQFSFGNLTDVSIRLLGRYQMENAALALTAVEVLEKLGWSIPESARRDGLAEARWPGRFELIGQAPAVIVDGGHNAQGARALAENLIRYFPGNKIVFVMGILADKDMDAILSPVLPLAKQIYTITPDNSRALTAKALAEQITAQGVPAQAIGSVAAALALAKQTAGTDGVVCYFGSLYSVAAARDALLAGNSTTGD
ncbi:MAG: bifunctional folylpolyglutamate synthase/dihydrofolate synthase [Oscillospiraceae bacterium]|nr:bifunctional folylpolyglutamate synthase/dihydrofolate synthase [Oscillospiraceae bacterium]